MSTSPPSRVIPVVPVNDSEQVSLFAKSPDIYPRAVHGWFAGWRWLMVALTQAVFYGTPWIRWGQRQAVLFDVASQRFYIFGLVLYPQDLIYLAALLVLSALALFLFTAVAGRLWCGYSCPQTVYTEMFMWVERHIEGDRMARMRLDAAPWSVSKLLRKLTKQAVWIGIALVTGFTFVGYFTPIRELAGAMVAGAAGAWSLFWIGFYGLATYGNAGYLREQMCKYICPYARFQSALIDKDSLIITYDLQRGEPRGSRSRKADPRAQGLGDCIDCTLCVQVCPTGIDIRHGLQNECIGCAACIDVCDDVMGKMGYAPGLIRYSTENGVAGRWSKARMFQRTLRPRVLIYAALLTTASAVFALSVTHRKPFLFDVIKDRGTLGRIIDNGAIENIYRLQLMNRSERSQKFRVSVSGIDGLSVSAPDLTVEGTQIGSMIVAVRLPGALAAPLQGHSTPVQFDVTLQSADPGMQIVQREKLTFYVPQ